VSRRLDHPDVEGFLGPFALDALDPDERDEVRDHLLDCVRCQAAIADYREAAALVGGAEISASTSLWDRIACRLE